MYLYAYAFTYIDFLLELMWLLYTKKIYSE